MPEDALTMTFEDRLLAQLKTELPGRPPAHRLRWLIGVAATATTAAAVALVTLGQPAYAIQTEPDGSLEVTMNSTEAADVARAEADLNRRGVRIELVASTHDCLDLLRAPTVAPTHHPLLSGPPSRDQHPALYAFAPLGDSRFVVRPDVIPAAEVLWVAIADNGTTLAMVATFAPREAPQPDFCA